MSWTVAAAGASLGRVETRQPLTKQNGGRHTHVYGVRALRLGERPTLETELRLVLTAAIAALAEEYRTVVVLRDVEGLSTREIAQITGHSVASMKVRTHGPRLELRRRLTAFLSGPRPPAARATMTPTTALRIAGNRSSQRYVIKVQTRGPRRQHIDETNGAASSR